jgi:hypothetical protein
MKKIVKMSLVAAVAVAGLTAANAKPLEEAIKDVDVSGSVVYRYNDTDTNPANGASDSHAQTNNYKIGVNLKSKVNDDVTANFRVITATGISTDGGFASLNTSTAADANPSFHVSNVYFGYTGIANTTVNVGKQGLTTPWTVATQIDDNEQTGTGILALSTVGPVTIAAAYFNQTNLNQGEAGAVLTGNEDIATLGLIANVGPVALDAWYLDMSDTFDTYTVGAGSSIDLSGVKLGGDVRYTSLDIDNDNPDVDNNLLKVTLTAKAGIVDGKYVYATTDKEGGLTALDSDAKTSAKAWGVNAWNKADADYHQFVVGVQALDSLHVSANYVTVKYNSDATGNDGLKNDKETELYTQLTYKMSSNLSSYVRFGTEEREVSGAKTLDLDYKGRLQVAYTF